MKHLNTPLPDALVETLTAYCAENGILKKKVMELALISWLGERGYSQQERPAIPTEDSFSDSLSSYSAKHLRKGKMEEGEL